MKQDEGGAAYAEDYPIYVGVAAREAGVAAPSLEAAIERAYQNAKDQGSPHRRFRVIDIVVTGDNPINEYKVVLGPVG